MATITVKCPTCDSELELDAAHRGQEVECGSCHQVFVAKPARADRDERDDRFDRVERPRKRPAPKRRSRRYEDDDDYDDDYYDRRREKGGDTGLGDASLIIGVVAMFLFWCPIIDLPLTVVGLVLGAMGLRSPRNGTAVAGLVFNIVFLIVSLLFMLFAWGFAR